MMPSVSKKQHNFMEAIAHSPSFAKKAGVPQSVGKEFSKADEGRKFAKGGDMKKMNMGGYADGGMTMVNNLNNYRRLDWLHDERKVQGAGSYQHSLEQNSRGGCA